MPLLLEDVRKEFAEFLKDNPNARWRMDAAFAHVVTLAYQRGFQEGVSSMTPKPENNEMEMHT